MSLLSEARIPVGEVCSFCFSFTYCLQESIALAHRLLIVTLYLRELSKGTSKDRVYVLSPVTRSEVEEIHIEWRYEYRTKWQLFPILEATYSLPLYHIRILSIPPCKGERLLTYISVIMYFEATLFIARSECVVECSPTRDMDRLEDMSLARATCTDDRCLTPESEARLTISTKATDGEGREH